MYQRLATLLLLALLQSLAVAHADFVVLESFAPSLPVGQLLADRTELTLADTERVVLLSDDGEIIEMDGPYTGLPRGTQTKPADLRNALTHLVDNTDNLYATLGSTRSGIEQAGNQAMHDDPWQLDPFRSGTQCVLDGAEVVFRRPAQSDALNLLVQRPGVDGDGLLDWPAGETLATWPKAVPLENGELYVLRRKGWLDNAMIRIVVLEPTIARSTSAERTSTAGTATARCLPSPVATPGRSPNPGCAGSARAAGCPGQSRISASAFVILRAKSSRSPTARAA